MKNINLNKITIKQLIIFSFLSIALMPLFVNAAGLVPCGGPNEVECTSCHLLVLAQNVLQFALKIAFLIVIGYIVYGGFRWIFSLGKEENLEAGQKIILNAIIGLIIILTAWIIVNTVFWAIKEMGGEDYTGTWYHIKCPENILNPENILSPEDENVESGAESGAENEDETGWEDADRETISDSNRTCLPIEISRECAAGFKLDKSKCEAGEHSITIKDEIISNGKGRYCEFVGDINPSGSEVNPCYPPTGTLYISCIVDPNYISPEEQIAQKKQEIEEKYPDLNGEWKEYPIMCPEWDQNCNEAFGAAECGMQEEIKDGFCFSTEPTQLLNPPGEIYGNGWHCVFGNTSNPEGKSFAYCIPKSNQTPATPVEPELESKCEECGKGLFNICDKTECLSLGDCNFIDTFGPGGKCEFNK